MDAKTAIISLEAVRDKGKEFRESYLGGSPFPHIIKDGFLPGRSHA
jgi:hypothetical protein